MKKINKNVWYMLFFIVIETIVIKAVMYDALPRKYFFDSNHIIDIMKGSKLTDPSYSYVANIFNKINIFGFYNVRPWGYLVSTIFTCILIKILSKNEKISKQQFIFLIACTALLNIYVFGITKDIVQFVYFLIVYLIISSKKIDNKWKVILSSVVLLYEALNFRIYYAIMMMIMDTIYVVYGKAVEGKIVSKKSALKIVAVIIIAFFVEVFVVQMLSTRNYNSIIKARSSVNVNRDESMNAVTIIKDPLGNNNNFALFIGNYCINFVRLIFPIELLLKGLNYIPFIIFQIYIGFNIILLAKNLNRHNIIFFACALSYIMVSVIFEPDFGSWIRHESALMLIWMEIIKINEGRKNISKEMVLNNE